MKLQSFLKVYSGEIRIIEMVPSEKNVRVKVLFQGFDEDIPLRFKRRKVISVHTIALYVITVLVDYKEDNQ